MDVCLFDGVYRHFQQYFSYTVAVSFIFGANRSTWREPPTFRKSLIFDGDTMTKEDL